MYENVCFSKTQKFTEEMSLERSKYQQIVYIYWLSLNI